ncbi:hypothetical protein KEM48_001454 [Puccinia striiformis f. sp. tritici PST-130]|nr:hypothetical protein KEM48_001454 [Puccinia striiformis f. sp. tritici PST-130]
MMVHAVINPARTTVEETSATKRRAKTSKTKYIELLQYLTLTTLESNHDVNANNLLCTIEKYNPKSAKTLSEMSDPLPVKMGPLEKSSVSHLKKEIDKISNVVQDFQGTPHPEAIESLTTQIKYLGDIVYN